MYPTFAPFKPPPSHPASTGNPADASNVYAPAPSAPELPPSNTPRSAAPKVCHVSAGSEESSSSRG
jgi:hypothetical protein